MKENGRKSAVKLLLAVLVIAAIAAIMFLVYDRFQPEGTKGAKEIVVEVFIPDEKAKEFTIQTDAEFLRQALEQEQIVSGTESEYGLFIQTAAGRTVDASKQEWWCITKDQEQVMTGVDSTPIADGDHFELTLTTGY